MDAAAEYQTHKWEVLGSVLAQSLNIWNSGSCFGINSNRTQ